LSGHTEPTGEGNEREMRISEIQEKVVRGRYQVDAKAVADAIVRRLMQERKLPPPERRDVQGKCS
jgi:anti-sigma28 factor (negative regulator of flagellin synthesis)